MIRKFFVTLFTAGVSMWACGETDYTRYVNTLQGTDSSYGLSHGNTYPTTGMPYGVHFWSAQTGRNGDGFKYCYSADRIRGFAQA
ncbi:MAG: glycoside hydrolase family 92 protein, partial [Muribaculaceae bacterium]|nr:glycoside hydrolase family 92 protein [Muribaculaceae bacterium]